MSFYVHGEFQLSTWDWPGHPPTQSQKSQMNQRLSQQAAVVSDSKTTQRNGANRRASAVPTGLDIAAQLTTSSADMASDPTMGTTKAFTKGVMFAAKNLKNNKKARRMLSRVGMKGMKQIAKAAISAGGDGDDVDLGDDDDLEDDAGDREGNEGVDSNCPDGGNNDCNINGPDEDQDVHGYPAHDVSFDPCDVEPQAQTMYNNPFMQQGSNISSRGQVSNSPDYR